MNDLDRILIVNVTRGLFDGYYSSPPEHIQYVFEYCKDVWPGDSVIMVKVISPPDDEIIPDDRFMANHTAPGERAA